MERTSINYEDLVRDSNDIYTRWPVPNLNEIMNGVRRRQKDTHGPDNKWQVLEHIELMSRKRVIISSTWKVSICKYYWKDCLRFYYFIKPIFINNWWLISLSIILIQWKESVIDRTKCRNGWRLQGLKTSGHLSFGFGTCVRTSVLVKIGDNFPLGR